MKMADLFFEIVEKSGDYVIKREKTGAYLIPAKEKSYFMPIIWISDIKALDDKLIEYITCVRSHPIAYFKYAKDKSITQDLFLLIKSLTNTDTQNFLAYIDKFMDYIRDTRFATLDERKRLGNIEERDFFAQRMPELYGGETPYYMQFSYEVPGLFLKLPLVRYGISGDIAYIYSVQQKKKYNNKHGLIQEAYHYFNRVNSSVKKNRNITPSMLISLTIFLGMLHAKGINEICADGFMTRRYSTYIGAATEEDKAVILNNAVNKFLKLFIRISSQFEGIFISAYPFEQDSYLHLKMKEDVFSENELLDKLFHLGETYIKELEENTSKELR